MILHNHRLRSIWIWPLALIAADVLTACGASSHPAAGAGPSLTAPPVGSPASARPTSSPSAVPAAPSAAPAAAELLRAAKNYLHTVTFRMSGNDYLDDKQTIEMTETGGFDPVRNYARIDFRLPHGKSASELLIKGSSFVRGDATFFAQGSGLSAARAANIVSTLGPRGWLTSPLDASDEANAVLDELLPTGTVTADTAVRVGQSDVIPLTDTRGDELDVLASGERYPIRVKLADDPYWTTLSDWGAPVPRFIPAPADLYASADK